MSEMSAGIRSLEMYERQSFYRERARREQNGLTVERPRRRILRSRSTRDAT